MRLRGYQAQQRDALLVERAPEDGWPCGRPRLVISPTGTGKTVTAIATARELFERTVKPILVLVHELGLLDQWRRRFVADGWAVPVEQGDNVTSPSQVARAVEYMGKPVVVLGSKATWKGGRLKRWPPSFFGAAIIDEAHRSVSSGYRRIIEHFDGVPWSGFTATAEGVEGLGDLWQVVYNELTVVGAIAEGWLVEPRFHIRVIDGWDISKLRVRKGADLTERQRATLFAGEEGATRMGVALQDLQREIGGAPCMSFWPSVLATKAAADWFESLGTTAEALVGVQATGERDATRLRAHRREVLARLGRGELQHVTLCQLGREGLDAPNAAVMADFQLTCSAVAAVQKLGRVLRPHESIAHALNNCATADERKAMIAASPKPGAAVYYYVPQTAKINLWRPQRLHDGLADLDADVADRKMRDGATLEDLLAAAKAAEEAKRARERALATAPDKIAEAAVQGHTFDLDEYKLLMSTPAMTAATAARWQGPTRVAREGAPRCTNEQRITLASALHDALRRKYRHHARTNGYTVTPAVRRAHAAKAKAAAEALYKASARWGPKGAHNEYLFMIRKYFGGHAPMTWPSSTRRRKEAHRATT